MFPRLATALYRGWNWIVARQTTRNSWTFDPISFAIGFVVALLLAVLVYRNRDRISRLRSRMQEKANQLRERLAESMAARYSASVVETVQTAHLFGALASFDTIYIEKRLFPVLAAAYDDTEHVPLLPAQAIQSSDRLAIIGRLGSGRTTLLNHLLLQHAKEVQTAGESERVPLYVYLPVLAVDLTDVAETDTAYDTTHPPVQRLVETALGSMSRLVASRVARWLRRQVEAGNALILFDGWDELKAADRPLITAWIQELFDTHPGNRLVVTAGERGYGPLLEAGFVPLQPAPWTHQQLTNLARRWVAAWPFKSNAQDIVVPSIPYSLTPPTPLEATVELVIRLRGQAPGRTPADRMAQVMDLLLLPPETDEQGNLAWPLDTGHRALRRLAHATFDQGRSVLERQEIQSTVTQAMPPPQLALQAEGEGDLASLDPKAAREEQDRRTLQIVDCCRALTATGGAIRSWDARSYFFAYPLVAAFLAAQCLATEGNDTIARAEDPAWSDVLRFYVGMAPAEKLVDHLLSATDDIFLTKLWAAAALLAAAQPGKEAWRAKVIKRLAQLFINPRLPALLRDRCLLALVESDEEGVALLFRQMTDSPEATLRAGAVLGLGALGRERDFLLIELALGDSHPQVRRSAITSLNILARTGNEKALELIMASMIEAEDHVQRLAVEALADLGGEGHAVLREGARDDDLIVRRGAVYGLSAVNEPWARDLLAHISREDDEWLVRNAAVEALESLATADDKDATPLELALPQAESEPWLIAWAAGRGEGTGVGDTAIATLVRAANEGDAPTRRKALDALRRLANPRTIDALRQTLRDPDQSVRQAALVALEETSRRHDIVIKRV